MEPLEGGQVHKNAVNSMALWSISPPPGRTQQQLSARRETIDSESAGPFLMDFLELRETDSCLSPTGCYMTEAQTDSEFRPHRNKAV